MKKNVAGQVVGVQMVSATDGSAFTGSVTVAVTVDAGTQATGSVGAGACTHKGNGFHTYAPAQAETNGDHVAFTFIGTGAIPATVQVYTTFPQTGDNFVRIGAPAGASVSADVAAVKSETASIVADTNELQTDWVNGGRLDLILDARASQTSVDTIDGNVDLILADTGTDGVVVAAASKTGYALSAAGVQAIWDALTSALTTATSIGKLLVDNINATVSSRASQTSVDTLDDFVDTEVAAIKAKTDQLVFTTANRVDSTVVDKTGFSLSAAGVTAIWDEVIEGASTARHYLRLMASALWGKLSGAATTTVTIRDAGDTKARITATVDADGNRSVVTTDAT